MKTLVTSLFLLGSIVPTFAHEGHSHGSLSAPHGGAVYEGKKAGVELVQEGSKIKLYPVDSNWKLIPVSDVVMTAQVEFPKKKPEDLLLKKESDHFSAEVVAKGAYRFQVAVSMSVKEIKESIRFQVEPQ